ncbi:MAG: IspD/TarI family cytidylyltransferase, partial [Nitrospirota bacterium]
MKTKVVAIVPAAGLGKRFSASEKKTFVKLSGTPLVIYTLKKLHKSASVTEIIPVLRQEDLATGLELIKAHNLNKIKRIVPGGLERQDSVYNALCLIKNEIIISQQNTKDNKKNPSSPPFCKGGKGGFLDDDLILIHDGARPFIPDEMIENLLQEIKGVDGVVPGMPVKETLKEVDIKKRIVLSTVKREKLWTIQTPQIFPFKVIKKAYDKAYADGFHATDDAALVERIGGKIKII